MTTETSRNRRKYPRVPMESIVSLEPTKNLQTLVLARNLSISGVRFESVGLRIRPGQVLRVTLDLEGQTGTVTGRVVWVTDLDAFTQDVGLEFLEVDPETAQLLNDHLPDAPDRL